ncbi:universal stress protein [Halolamina salifodinae]|uniref:Nucleotide-binding universal stress UspA family protein n=1 Tax=Halolamina salifodinae TaxID=1202767 RepID=A0A8T4H0I9_9EURY|nr:universal stress protein [Halolamina salifodinae]MBP1988082.1 nucleotide-binding universal stress UspA family protein [Halolamina salifodinae]
MSNDDVRATVPIVAPKPPSNADTGSNGYGGEIIHRPSYSIVVPIVSDPFDSDAGINAHRFLQTAIALAADNDGKVLLLGIAEVDSRTGLEQIREHDDSKSTSEGKENAAPETVQERQRQLRQVLKVAEGLHTDLTLRAVVRAVTDTTQGILDSLDGGSKTAVLFLRGTGFNESWLLGESTIDTVVEEADCDVFVENIGVRDGAGRLYVPDDEGHTVASLAESEAESIDSILLPVGAGPHAALASEGARAVAHASDASVTALHVIPLDSSDQERSDATDLLEFAEFVLGPDIESNTVLREAPDPTDAIIDEATSHDFTAIGSPEQKFQLRDLVFKPVQETLARRNDVTILMCRDSDRTSRSLYYRYKQAMDTNDDEQG